MRRVAFATLAISFLAGLHPLVRRRRVALRLGLLAVAGLLGLPVLANLQPEPTQALPPREVPQRIEATAFRTALRTNVAPDEAVSLTFSAPMDPTSVRSSLRVEPRTAVRLTWDAGRRVLNVRPVGTWATGTYHTVTVDAGALAASGQPLPGPARAAFVTRASVTAYVTLTDMAGKVARPASGIEIAFSGRVDRATMHGAVETDPPIPGTLRLVSRSETGDRYRYRPHAPLPPDREYRVRLSAAIRDDDGAPIEVPPELTFRTAAPPEIVRFRPANEATEIDRTATLSVRFNTPMDRRSTKAALSVTARGERVEGVVRLAGKGSVLVFDPARRLPYGATVTVRVAATARSEAGVALGRDATVTFVVEPQPPPPEPAVPPAPAAATDGTTTPVPPPVPIAGGGSAGGGTWAAVERFYLGLMNCTRTGGWVTSSGSCSSPGGRDVAPLKLDSGISSKVARPYAKTLATRGACTHFIGGGPDDRLRRAGYTGYVWAENLGCRSGDARKAVLGTHLGFQAERPYDGGHYRHIMDPKFDRVGIGVWVSGGRVRLVVDFYRPR